MKNKKIILLIILIAGLVHLVSSITIAGGADGAGGSGVAQKINGQLAVTVTDLYRAQIEAEDNKKTYQFDKIFLESQINLDIEVQSEYLLLLALEKIRHLNSIIALRLIEAKNNLQWTDLPLGTHLSLIHDYYDSTHSETPKSINNNSPFPLNSGQFMVQIVSRENTQLLRDLEYYNAMDAINRMALKLHELIYTISNHANSVSSQRFVALVLSNISISSSEFNKIVTDTMNLKYQTMERNIKVIDLPPHVQIAYERYPGLGILAPSQGPGWVSPEIDDTVYNIRKKSTCGELSEVDKTTKSFTYTYEDTDYFQGVDFWVPSLPREKSKTIKLNEKNWEIFYKIYKSTNDFLMSNFPDYIYPESGFRATKICFKSKKVNYLSISYAFYESRNDEALAKTRFKSHEIILNQKIKLLENQLKKSESEHDSLDQTSLLLSQISSAKFSLAHEEASTVWVNPPTGLDIRTLGEIILLIDDNN